MTAGSAHQSAADHMDRIYRYQRYIYDITRKPYLLGRDRILGELDPPQGGQVLEVGCGTGRNLIKAAKMYPGAEFFGFDISSAMLQTAHRSVERASLQSRIHLTEGDATNFDGGKAFGHATFDRVYISYALSMIPPWREALAHSFTCVKPGGTLLIADFGQQEDLPHWFRSLLFAWLRQFDVFPIKNLRAELEDFAAKNNADVRFRTLYRGYAYIAALTRSE